MMVNKHSSGEGSDFLYWLLTLQCGNWEWFQKLGPCSLQEHQDANVLKRHLECLSQPQWAGCPVKWIEEWPIKPESVSLQQNQVTAINYNPTTLNFFFLSSQIPRQGQSRLKSHKTALDLRQKEVYACNTFSISTLTTNCELQTWHYTWRGKKQKGLITQLFWKNNLTSCTRPSLVGLCPMLTLRSSSLWFWGSLPPKWSPGFNSLPGIRIALKSNNCEQKKNKQTK